MHLLAVLLKFTMQQLDTSKSNAEANIVYNINCACQLVFTTYSYPCWRYRWWVMHYRCVAVVAVFQLLTLSGSYHLTCSVIHFSLPCCYNYWRNANCTITCHPTCLHLQL